MSYYINQKACPEQFESYVCWSIVEHIYQQYPISAEILVLAVYELRNIKI